MAAKKKPAKKTAQSKAVESALSDLVIANRILANEGVIDAFGHVSIRHPERADRYFLARSITWAEEIMLFLMVGCVFFGAATPAWGGRHIRMDVFLRMAPPKVRDALNLLSDAALVVTSIVLVVFALPTLLQFQEFDQRSMAANIPLVIPQAAIPIGLGLMALLGIARIVLGRWRDPADTSSGH